MSLAIIAVNRCVALVNPDLSKRLFGGWRGGLVIMSVWIYAHGLLIPIYTKVGIFFPIEAFHLISLLSRAKVLLDLVA